MRLGRTRFRTYFPKVVFRFPDFSRRLQIIPGKGVLKTKRIASEQRGVLVDNELDFENMRMATHHNSVYAGKINFRNVVFSIRKMGLAAM
jgi:hypothetical protein